MKNISYSYQLYYHQGFGLNYDFHTTKKFNIFQKVQFLTKKLLTPESKYMDVALFNKIQYSKLFVVFVPAVSLGQ